MIYYKNYNINYYIFKINFRIKKYLTEFLNFIKTIIKK